MGSMKNIATLQDKKVTVAHRPGNSLIASAARLGVNSVKNLSRGARDAGWQRAAWDFYHGVGEFRYACDWVGSMMSKAILFASAKDEDGVRKPVLEGLPFVYMDELFGDDDGKTEMLRLIGIHMTVAGKCYLVGYDSTDPNVDERVWQVVASTEINRGPGEHDQWRVNDEYIDVPPADVLVVEIWRPDPEKPQYAMAPSRPLLPVLGEISRLTDHVAAQVDSRLAGAGILLMPQEMTFPAPPETTDDEGNVVVHKTANNAEAVMEIINEAMATSIEDRDNASALVPIVITAPGDVIDKVKHLTFWTELDGQAIELRNEAIRRLALGMDMPPEVLQGTGDSNHWAAWQADEAAIKSHTEPLLKIITTALSEGYLRPMLRASVDSEEARKFSVMADTSEMRLRPNRSKEALELYNLGVISRETLIRETGFDPQDAMRDDERAQWFLMKVAGGSTTPELVEAALRALGVPLGNVSSPEGESSGEETQEARPTPSLREHPTQDIPDRERGERRKAARENGDVPSALVASGASDAVIAASEQIVVRALERAGNKLKNKMTAKPRVAAAEIYQFVSITPAETEFLLDDAWAHVGPIASRYGMDGGALTHLLHGYTADVLVNAKPHTYEDFTAYLTPKEAAA